MIVRTAQFIDAVTIGSNLRPADKQEVLTVSGNPGAVAVPQAYALSLECFVACPPGGRPPCVIFGVAEGGIVWLLATPEAHKHSRAIMKLAPGWLDRLAVPFPEGLHNWVDERNTLHLQWCLRTGFLAGNVGHINGHRFIHVHRPNRV